MNWNTCTIIGSNVKWCIRFDTRLSQKVKNIATLQFNNTSSTDLKLIEVKMTKGYLQSNVYCSIAHSAEAVTVTCLSVKWLSE